jgi:hypothetical protein
MTIRFDAEFGSVLTGQAIIGPAFSTGKREWSLQYGASSGDLRFQVSSGGGSWTDNMTVTPTGGLTANTRYQFKLVWSGTQLDWYEKPGVLGVDYEGVAEEWELLGTDSSFMNISSLNDEASGPMTIGARTAGGRTQSTIRIYEYILEVDGSEVERINGTIADLNTTTDTFSTDYLSWAWLSSDGDLAVTAPTAESGEAGASNGSGVLTVTSGFLSLSGAGHASSEGSGDLSVQTIVGPADLIITWYQIYEMNNGANGGEGTFDPVYNPSGDDKQFTQLPPTGTGTSGPTGGTGGIVGHGTVVVTEDRPRVLRPARQIIRPGGRK